MLAVKFWFFQKKQNSTKQPDETAKYTYPAQPYESLDVLAPVLLFNPYNEDFPQNQETKLFVNYAYIPKLKRYYFIENWTHEPGGLWAAHFRLDVLASWRDNIMDFHGYASRATSKVNSDGTRSHVGHSLIIDNTYPMVAGERVLKQYDDTVEYETPPTGTYIIGVVNGDPRYWGAVSYYALEDTGFSAMCAKLMNAPDWLDIHDISEELLKTLWNPFQYVVSCVYFPFFITKFFPDFETKATVGKIKVGWWEVDIGDHLILKITKTSFTVNCSIPVPVRYTCNLSPYMHMEPYSIYTLFQPGFGNMQISAAALYGKTAFNYSVSCDIMTGKAVMQSEALLAPVYGNMGVSVQLAQIVGDTLWTAVSALVGGGGKALGGFIGGDTGGLISNAANGIASAISAATTGVQSTGSNGSLVEYTLKPCLTLQYRDIVSYADGAQFFGYPISKSIVAGEYRGFTKFVAPAVDFPCMELEKESINSALESGVYIE